ncbi:MAG: HEPN domain-containing protein [Kiritimatiellae bacterium]|nr:HEPN domain-containing protein [Kiritimatiellia bacterium]
MSEEIEIAKQWAVKAHNDLLNADNNLNADKVPFDTVCFHCQQAAEKLLKAFLAVNGDAPPITHDLFSLLQKIIPFNKEAEILEDELSILMPYAVEVAILMAFFCLMQKMLEKQERQLAKLKSGLKTCTLNFFKPHDTNIAIIGTNYVNVLL